MNVLKQTAKQCFNYTLATFALIRLRLQRTPTLLILTYHRILPASAPERATEQPGMALTPESLDSHLRLLRRLGAEFVSLDGWLQSRHKAEALPRLAVAVTFDDGWQDNYQYAFPVLRQHQVPATIFLVSRRVNTPWQFWPERILNILLNHDQELDHPALAWLREFGGTRNLTSDQANGVIENLKQLDDETIEARLAEAESAIPALKISDQRFLLNKDEMKQMRDSGLIDFGAHTRHHYRLNHLKEAGSLESEICGSLEDLKADGLSPVDIFCYPNGNITSAGEKLVSDNFQAACTTQRGWNTAGVQPHLLSRFSFHDGNGGTNAGFLATLVRPGQ